MQRIIPILAIALLISVSSVLSTFAQQEPQFFGGQIGAPSSPDTVIRTNAFQGTNSADRFNLSSEAFLKWKQIFQDGTEQGSTEPIATIFRQLTFVSADMRLRTLQEAQVIAVIDVSKIGTEICYETAKWNLEQTVFVNGRSVTIAKARIIPDGLKGTLFEQAGLTFHPNLVEILLENQGIILKTGDKVIWKIDASYRFNTFRGDVETDLRGNVKCKGSLSSQVEGYGFGFITQMTFTWVDPLEAITRPTTTAPDLDGDGIPDSIDQCDFSPEIFNGFQDEDGCPDADPVGFIQPVFRDTDGDGILDIDDLCPTQPEIFNGVDDFDGCPDGAVLDVNFASVPIDEPLVSFTETVILPPLPSIEEILTTASQTIGDQTEPSLSDEIDLLEDEPLSEFNTNTDPIVIQGQTGECDPNTQDCNAVILKAIRDFEQQTGIMLPFQPTIFNIILILAGIVIGILVIRFLLRRRK